MGTSRVTARLRGARSGDRVTPCMRHAVLCVLLGTFSASGGSDAVNASRRQLSANLYYVGDPCDSDPSSTTAVLNSPICMVSPADTSIDASVRPPTSEWNPVSYAPRTRCCWGTGASAQCDSESAASGGATCYPTGQTWAEADATCTGDGGGGECSTSHTSDVQAA